jgi:membrane protease YdiL (CAAX protease family)
VKRFFLSEIGAVVTWVLASLFLAAVISPWIYQGGKALAAAAQAGDLPGVIEWLAAACGRAKFGRFFDRSLLLSALVLLPLLLYRVRRLQPSAPDGPCHALRPLSWPNAARHAMVACALSGGLLWVMVLALDASGALVPAAKNLAPGKALQKILLPAIAAPLVEEWLFRGLLLGLWLRFARPVAACIGTSLVFAIVHFLKPPAGTVIGDPSHWLAGFQLLGKILLHFIDPRFFVADFATLLGVGMILAWARLRTASLWFPIGLHAGWIVAFKAFNQSYRVLESHPLHPWAMGDSMRSGLLPLLTLAVTLAASSLVLRRPGFTRASP